MTNVQDNFDVFLVNRGIHIQTCKAAIIINLIEGISSSP